MVPPFVIVHAICAILGFHNGGFVMAVPSYQYSLGIFVRFITLYRKSRLIIARATMYWYPKEHSAGERGESKKSKILRQFESKLESPEG